MIVIHAPVPDEVRAALEEACKRRDAAIVETPADDWDRKVIDQAIAAMAGAGRPFSVNDIRPLLPVVRQALINGAFGRACKSGLIRRVGFTPSTLPSTRGHMVSVYAPTRHTPAAPTETHQ